MRRCSTGAAAAPGSTAPRACRPRCRWGFGWAPSSAAAGSPTSEGAPMKRRTLVAGLVLVPIAARAHHGWSSFDQGRPIWLEGTARKVAWRNPHAELELELNADLKVPADLAQRPVPAQSSPVEGAKLLSTATVPTR